MFRIGLARYLGQAYFGRQMLHRFDAPDGSFGVCYLGTTLFCCLGEVFSAAIDRQGSARILGRSHLREYTATTVEVLQPLRLANLADDGLLTLGTDQRVTGGDDYDLSQRWAAAIHAHAENLDGILYPTRHHNRLFSVALFERARSSVVFRPWGRLAESSTEDLWIDTVDFLSRFEIDLIDEPEES